MVLVEDILRATFKELMGIYSDQDYFENPSAEKGRFVDRPVHLATGKMIFPCYYKDREPYQNRISEQELRFLFVKKLLDSQNDYYYSVETPTQEKYQFTGVKKFISGNIDLCLYKREGQEYRRCHLLEFKNKNGTEKGIKKDFEKLLTEPVTEGNYFIHLIEKADSGTYKNLSKKYNNCIEKIGKKENAPRLSVFLCCLQYREVSKYTLSSPGMVFPSEIEKWEPFYSIEEERIGSL